MYEKWKVNFLPPQPYSPKRYWSYLRYFSSHQQFTKVLGDGKSARDEYPIGKVAWHTPDGQSVQENAWHIKDEAETQSFKFKFLSIPWNSLRADQSRGMANLANSQMELEFNMLSFVEGRKPVDPEKTPWIKIETKQTLLIYDAKIEPETPEVRAHPALPPLIPTDLNLAYERFLTSLWSIQAQITGNSIWLVKQQILDQDSYPWIIIHLMMILHGDAVLIDV